MMPASAKKTQSSRRPVADGGTEHRTTDNGREAQKEKGEGEEEEEEREKGGVGEGSRGDGVGKAEAVAVDDQIAALERELEGNSSSGSSSGDDSSDDDDSITDADILDRGSRKRPRVAKLVSPLEAEKIEPLAPHLLPRPGCGITKIAKKKKKERPKKAPGVVEATPGSSQGLDSAVKELMANYEARSSERVPFYCRVCQFQGDRYVVLMCVGVFAFAHLGLLRASWV